jgi:hypothetical protein
MLSVVAVMAADIPLAKRTPALAELEREKW